MHSSGIDVTDELRVAFVALVDKTPDLSYICISIADDKFVIAKHGTTTGSDEDDFTVIQNELEDKTPIFVCKFFPASKEWSLIQFVPDNSKVRDKMVFASSAGALRNLVKIDKEYPITAKEECTWGEYNKFLTGYAEEVVMSAAEQMHKSSAYEASSLMSELKVSAIVGVPIKVAENVTSDLEKLKSGSLNTVAFRLEPDDEILTVADASDSDIATICSTYFTIKEPRYVVHNYAHNHDGADTSKTLFFYYCPGDAPPKLKMMYSTCKSNISKIFETVGITEFTNFECDSASEVSVELVEKELYPKEAVSTAFKKPSARGRGKARVAKFKPN